MSERSRLGSEAEDRAAGHLLGLGYTLIGRRVRVGPLELDLIAFDGETLVFVEVKSSARFAPEERLDRAKAERLMEAAERFAREHGLEGRLMRFDLIAIQGQALRHHKDAFQA